MKKLVWCLLTSILLVGIPSQAFPQTSDIKDPNADLIGVDTTWLDGAAGLNGLSLMVRIKNLNFETARNIVVKVEWEPNSGFSSIRQIYDLAPGEETDVYFSVPRGHTGYRSITARPMGSK